MNDNFENNLASMVNCFQAHAKELVPAISEFEATKTERLVTAIKEFMFVLYDKTFDDSTREYFCGQLDACLDEQKIDIGMLRVGQLEEFDGGE